jgi:lysophospholipase L1-like esterase
VTARYLIIFLLFGSLFSSGQTITPPINHQLNRISYGELNHFFSKLELIEKSKAGKAVVVQIGDSHTQPDFISSVVRTELQNKFGNGGRGLLFPYTLALSNSPADIKSSSSIKWQYNRVAHPELGTNSGISGFIIYTGDSSGDLTLLLDNEDDFDSSLISMFFDKSAGTSFNVSINDDSIYQTPQNNSITYAGALQKIKIGFIDNDSTFAFYGVTVENKKSGLIYHNIGVNGARYDQYNITPGFWKDLATLNADLFIISLGTNEAQKDSFNISAFQSELRLFVTKLKEVAPTASVLITTAMDSYKKQKPNQALKQINEAMAGFCLKENIALWDLYKISNGLGSSRQWLKLGLMNRDRIHYLQQGYRIQGELLYKALINGYSRYKQENQN